MNIMLSPLCWLHLTRVTLTLSLPSIQRFRNVPQNATHSLLHITTIYGGIAFPTSLYGATASTVSFSFHYQPVRWHRIHRFLPETPLQCTKPYGVWWSTVAGQQTSSRTVIYNFPPVLNSAFYLTHTVTILHGVRWSVVANADVVLHQTARRDGCIHRFPFVWLPTSTVAPLHCTNPHGVSLKRHYLVPTHTASADPPWSVAKSRRFVPHRTAARFPNS
jgi:hypothetical protein